MLLGDGVTRTRAMTISVLGVAFTVGFDERIAASDVRRIAATWERCAIAPGGESTIHVDAVLAPPADDAAPGRMRIVGSSLAHLEESLTSSLTVRAIGERRSELLMLHACGIATPDGRVVALVAASGTGKTTAARTLGRSFQYVSDETVAVDGAGSVVPYPKPLSVKTGEGAPKKQLSPADAALLPLGSQPLALSAIVLLDRRATVAEASVEPVDPLDALCELVPQTSYLSVRERPLAELLAAFDARGGVRRFVYSEASSLPPLIERLLQAPGCAVASSVTVIPSAELDRTAHGPLAPTGPAVRRRAVRDAVIGPDDDLVVFVHSTVVRLSGIGPLVWRSTAAWIGIDALVARVVDEIGAPPEGLSAVDLVHATLNELADAGVVELSESAESDTVGIAAAEPAA